MSEQETVRARQPPFIGSTWWLIAFLAIAGYFLVTEHQAHAIAALPWLLVGACVFMHLFMHGSHGGHGGTGKPSPHGADGEGAGQAQPDREDAP